MVAAGEPSDRLHRAALSLVEQTGARVDELVVAVPPNEVDEVVEHLSGLVPTVRAVPNPTGRRSAGLNRALHLATGDYVCRVDARSVLPPDYVDRCVRRLAGDQSVGVVGGTQDPMPGGPGPVARGIARALANPWALGAAAYRTGRAGPVDTVYLGSYRREDLLALGGWSELLEANEDFELCQRYRARGDIIWLEPDLRVGYEARTTYRSLADQYRAFGRSKVDFWRRTGARPAPRQYAAMILVGAVTASALAALARRPKLTPGLAAAGLAGLVAFDQSTAPSPVPLRERIAALGAYVTIWGAWTGGIVQGASKGAPS